MEQPKSVIRQEFDRSGQYESGLKSLVKSLQWAFAFLLVVIIGMLIYFFTGGGYFSVEPQRAVIVLRFGEIQQTYLTGGHWFLPYPVNQFVEIQTNQQSLNINFMAQDGLEGAGDQSLEPGRDAYLLTGDANIIHASWLVNYHVSSPEKYYTALATPLKPVENNLAIDDPVVTDADGFSGTRGPQTLLRNLFRQAVIQVTSSLKVDDILYAKQGQYSDAVMSRFQALVNMADCGISIDNVTLKRVFPPLRTKAAFDDVAAASNTQSTLINKANEYKVQIENDVQARKAEVLASAQTYKLQIVSSVKAESNYFASINKEYQVNPGTVLMALYTSTLSEVLQNEEGSKFILGTGSDGKGSKEVRLLLNPEPKRRTVKFDQTAEVK